MGYSPPHLFVRRLGADQTGISSIGTATGDKYLFYPNLVDVRPYIYAVGASDYVLDLPTGHTSQIWINGVAMGSFGGDATTFYMFSDNAKNIALIPNGAGKVQFGTYTADAAVTQAGYVDILDNGGNLRHLACITP